ncbi:putative lipid II flippase MurJ [Pullulanibacillus camelliae]|uniref:Putative lipid II flippase MurJ n=1 Tax=Pullulanibacillus camelliae TaxID=1707096 RepID=A0A8J2YNK1_9BACL|nr:lipid II flippase MurJ [Pullulanibacillus camelliae]GGE56117.1 putative lipid II flippase MurJ [Pullulanibacillus camelliae]
MAQFRKTAVIIILLALALKLAGFLRESLIAKQFGATHTTDGFLLSYTILTLFMLIVSTGFNNVFLPLYAKLRETEPEATDRNANGLLNLSVLIFVVMGFLLFWIAPFAVRTLFYFMDTSTRDTALDVGRFYSLYLVLWALTGVLESYLQAKYSYIPTHIAKLLGTLFSAVFGLFFAQSLGIMSFAYGFAFGTLVGIMIQAIALLKGHFHWLPTISISAEFRRRFLLLLWPALLNAVVAPFNVTIDKLFASTTIGGAVTYLNNASLIVSIPNVIYTTTIGAIIFTLLTDNRRSLSTFIRILSRGIESGMLIFMPLAVGLALTGKEVVALIYQRGAFTHSDTLQTYIVLALYTPLIFTQGIQMVVAKALYALEKTKTLLKISSVTIVFNIVFNALFMKFFGFKGLALSSTLVSIYYLIASVLALYRAMERVHDLKDVSSAFFRTLLPTAIMTAGVLCYKAFGAPLLPPLSGLQLIIEVLIGVIVYVFFTYALNKKGFQTLWQMIKRK